ncbi:hypothetical protein [Halorientalis regularis]|jgi:hypothetical protein|uniref:DUF7847 domain-containing protein n=1 Tax=Halorientalis regularis TaxID=660518 RepID=A0A1G7I391_9EURY|nr:hypothetical protein [Halorientalis regularis]SDF06819.1 hypothetical protein SAMN05216218_103252 [Halorientalis regularis]
MSLDIEKALGDGLDRVLTQPGAYLVGAFLALGLANTVVVQSLLDVAVEFVVEEFGPQMAETGSLDEFRNEVGVLPFAVSLPPTLLAVAFVALAFVGEALGIVGVRLFAASDPDRLPDGLADGLPLATVNGFLAGIFVFVIVTVGFVVGLIGLIVGGFVLATFLVVSLVFVRQAVALEDENAIGALSESWSVAKGSRWYLFGLLVILGVIGAVVGGVIGLIGGLLGPAVNALANVIVGAVVGVFGIAVTTRAYQQLRTERGGATGVDDDRQEPGGRDDVY